ncbi:MAG: hypothetical protein NT105_13565 [Verrucomicrobia bacterium]|nr:hypothetical protein [Verrucomicrobiota bacterium]
MKKVLLWIGGVLVAVPVVLIIGAVLYVRITVWTTHVSAMHRLYAADPKELLAACRIVMTNYPSYRPDPNWGKKDNIPDPTDPKMPEVIRKLQPRGVIVRTVESIGYDDVEIVLGRDAIITALPEGKIPEGRSFNGKKILEGLYYFECKGGG